MTAFAALSLGVLQGLTEFLPVSSSGHLALADHLLGVRTEQVGTAVAAHVGTLVAVLWAYRGSLRAQIRRPRAEQGPYLVPFFWALAGTAPLALLLAPAAERAFGAPQAVALGFLLTSGLLLLLARLPRHGSRWPGAIEGLLIGVSQGVAVWPGLSRSGTTIAVGRALGVESERAAEFTFLLSIPTIAAALLRELAQGGLGGSQPGLLVLSAAAAAVTGALSLRWLLGTLRSGRVWLFSFYTLMLAGVGLWLG